MVAEKVDGDDGDREDDRDKDDNPIMTVDNS